jgi:hypothetical protein
MKTFHPSSLHLLLSFSSFILLPSSFLHAQMAVFDGANQATALVSHSENLAKWVESINKATEQINKLNDVVSNLNDVQGLIGKGMESIGIDPSITSTIDLAKAVNNFGTAMQGLQHNAGNVSFDLERIRQETTNPNTWQRYATTSKSYEATQKAQKDYDEQMKKLQQERAKAQAQLKAAKSLGETSKAQAALDSVDAAAKAMAEERKRAFEQQQANWIENQNQKEAWEQAAKDWTKEELKKVGSGLGDYLKEGTK